MVSTTVAAAEALAYSTNLIATYESAISASSAHGAMRAMINLENEIRKERRRMRALSNEDPDVLVALARQRDADEARERTRRRAVADANARTHTAAKLKQEIKCALQTLKKRKQEIPNAESLLEMKQAMKT